MQSEYEYKAGQIEEFVTWLAANGAEMRDLTNDWEVARWYANGVTGVVYVNKRGILSFSDATASKVWKKFIRDERWGNTVEVKKTTLVPLSSENVVRIVSQIDDSPPWDADPAPEVTSNRSIDLDEAYMQMAEVWAKRSHANRLQVGALIVKDKQIISDGYNGMPAGSEKELCEEVLTAFRSDNFELKTKPEVLHAESNAISKLARHGGMGALGATMYITHAPCLQCAKLIVQSGIAVVYYRNTYRSEEGLAMLKKFGVAARHLTGE